MDTKSIDLSTFITDGTFIPKDELLLSFPTYKPTLNVAVSRLLIKLGYSKVQLKISPDYKIVAAVGSNEVGNTLFEKCKTSGIRSVHFSSRFIADIVRGKFKGQGVKFIGTYDENLKAVLFDLDKPIYY